MRSIKGSVKSPKRPLWNPPELRVNVVNIDPPNYFAPRAKLKVSVGQKIKNFLVGQNGILRKDLLNWNKNKIKK